MLSLLRAAVAAVDLVLGAAAATVRAAGSVGAVSMRLGPLRYVAAAAVAYGAFALLLVYVVAPARGYIGQTYLGAKLRYDAERWLATGIYDARGSFVGTFDARLDSRRDVNFTDAVIEVGDYTANPDHKSIPVAAVPDWYWRCLVHQEDRYLGTWLNPFGIDLAGVLKIPVSSVQRSLALRRPSLGVGGSTLPMQFARVIYKTPPHSNEGGFEKLRRKFAEWWLAPVIYRELTREGDTALKQWAANHLWLAQRTGGAPLHGVEVTSRVVFGKEAADLSIAEQFVLASAVNKPIILLEGNPRLNQVRLDRWRYITEVRARVCAERLVEDEAEKAKVLFELVNLAGGPPDPQVRPRLQEALDRYAPALATRAQANPVIRANALLPAARYGLREEMKQAYGFGWREHVRGVTTSLDAAANLAFGERIRAELVRLDGTLKDRISPGFTLDPAQAGPDRKVPAVVVVAANEKGEIVRYFETTDLAPYFGSILARDAASGRYDPARESRMIASTGKMLAAIAIANSGRDSAATLYLDTEAPTVGLETCAKGGARHGRRAIVAFACSLNSPLLNRTARAGQAPVRRLIDAFGFAMPPPDAEGHGTPPSTAAVLGQIAGAPRRVQHVSSVILGALVGRGAVPVRPPSLVRRYDYVVAGDVAPPSQAIVPNSVIRRGSAPLLRALLEAPLCYTAGGAPAGTLKSLAHWCPARRGDLRLHFAKTGTQVASDPNATVDVWISGGLQFKTGAAYSYVVLVGTGTASEPWGTKLHAAQVAAPLLDALLTDLAGQNAGKRKPTPAARPAAASSPVAGAPAPRAKSKTAGLGN